MQEVEPWHEVLILPEAVGLAFEDLDFVVETLQGAGGNALAEIGQEAAARWLPRVQASLAKCLFPSALVCFSQESRKDWAVSRLGPFQNIRRFCLSS